jgi:hypothetical protein
MGRQNAKKLESNPRISQEYWQVKHKITSFLLKLIDKTKNVRYDKVES